MASVSQNLVGRRVYSSGSYAPTRGTVNPKGYIERESRKRGIMRNNDKPSQKRSGLAQTALRRTLARDIMSNIYKGRSRDDLKAGERQYLNKRIGARTNNIDGRVKNLGPDLKKDYWRIIGNMRGNQAEKKPSPVGNKPKPGGGSKPNTPAVPGSNAPIKYTPPDWIKINTNGQLDLPYDESMSWEMLHKKQEFNKSLLDLQQQEQEQGLQYGQMKRDADLDYEDVQRGTLNQAASKGMAFSSGYGHAVGENANQYNRFLGDLESRNSAFKGNIASNRNAIESAFNDFLRQQALARAMKLEDDAGTLGYGRTVAQPSYLRKK